MTTLSIIIKPASSRCNLKCQYCFYKDDSLNRSCSDYGVMKIEDLEVIIQNILNYARGHCSFLFQGGEPTLVGLDFYRQVILFQKKYNVHHVRINNSIQTNGLLLDESWINFFKEHHFLVGLSLDGIKKTHDFYRGDNFEQVIKVAKLLQQYNVEFNILTVVTDEVAKHINEIYDFYQKSNFKYLQFIPCLDLLGKQRYLSIESYTTFLKILFDRWFLDILQGKQLSIGYFDDLLSLLCGEIPMTCGRVGRCGWHYAIESDGSVYPCDFYMMDSYYLGNLVEDDFELLNEKRRAIKFGEFGLKKFNSCQDCSWYRLCYGGCQRERELGIGKNKYCQSYQSFFEYAYPRLRWLASRILIH